jgi:hypothetical protein
MICCGGPLAKKNEIRKKIFVMADSLLNGKKAFLKHTSKPYIFKLKYGAESSLYVLHLDNNERAIVSVDEDPLFNKVHFTLYRLVDAGNANAAYKIVGEQLYRSENLME